MDDRPPLDPNADNGPAAPEGVPDQARLGELRAAVARGLEDIKAGRVADVDEAFARIEAMLDELEAAKRG